MRALVISGGGCKGAFAGGVAEYLIKVDGRKYDIFLGTSTGSLLVPHLSIGAIDEIREVFTSVGQKDIYNICPFNIKTLADGTLKSSINHLNVVRMFFKRKKTFGETKNLRKTISRVLSKETFKKINQAPEKVIVTASNLTTKRVEYKYARDNNYEDFCDWMWVSSSFVPFMSLIEKNGYEYADGGFGNYLPIEEAVNIGATEIDVIVLRPRHKIYKSSKSRNAFDLIMQSMEFMLNQIANDDIFIGHLESIYNQNVHINFFFTPRDLTAHSFYFDPVRMQKWWKEGFEYTKQKLNE